MVVRKQGKFEALNYDGTSKLPVLVFRGGLDVNDSHYLVLVEGGSDGSVRINLAPEAGGCYNFILCPEGLVAIRDDQKKYLSKPQFLERAEMSDADVSGLVRLLKRESRALFGSSAGHMLPCLDEMCSEPFISEFRAVLHKTLEPLLESLKLSREDREKIYGVAVNCYYQSSRLM
ncbi:Uncharacterised protein [uncultured archaeon]|nr:Uncharacterised protein [uncultured archaeon]